MSRSFTYVTLVQRLQDERKSVTQSFVTSQNKDYYGVTNDVENVTLNENEGSVTGVTLASHEKVPSDGYFQRIINPNLRGDSDEEMMINLFERLSSFTIIWIIDTFSTF